MKYNHIENKDKEYIDWRLPEKRMEGFLMWLKWRMKWCDLDHYACNNSYRDYAKMTKEQTYWYSMIFGMTYQSEMAWVIYSQFPDVAKIDLGELQKWNLDNLPRQKYAKDTKYNKGRITEQVKSIQESIDKTNGSLVKYIEDGLVEDEQKSFEKSYEKIMTLYKYGRMTTWITLQTLHETAGVPVRPSTMLAWDESSWSVRSGLMYLYNRDEKIEAKNKNVGFDKSDIPWIKKTENELLSKCKDYLGEHSDMFTHYLLESHLCQYKKLVLGGDYAGHSSGDHVSRANILRDLWPEVDFKPFYDSAIMNHSPLVRGNEENKLLRNLCKQTGQLINMHEDFNNLPNMYLELNFKKEWLNKPEFQKKLKFEIDNYNYSSGNFNI